MPPANATSAAITTNGLACFCSIAFPQPRMLLILLRCPHAEVLRVRRAGSLGRGALRQPVRVRRIGGRLFISDLHDRLLVMHRFHVAVAEGVVRKFGVAGEGRGAATLTVERVSVTAPNVLGPVDRSEVVSVPSFGEQDAASRSRNRRQLGR